MTRLSPSERRARFGPSAGDRIRLGQTDAVDLVFHNAYGPDKAWFRDPALSAGGCVIDLGIHLVDRVTAGHRRHLPFGRRIVRHLKC